MKHKLLFPATILVCLFLSNAAASADGPQEIPLWAAGAPGSEGKTAKEAVRITADGEHVVSSVHHPSLSLYLPPQGKQKTPRTAVIIIPGGGHRELWMDHEGYNLAQWLSERGIAAFVLKYRLAREPNSTYTIDDHALADTKRAIRLVRSRAADWNIAPERVGVIGFFCGRRVGCAFGYAL